jgi:hypothetical protein
MQATNVTTNGAWVPAYQYPWATAPIHNVNCTVTVPDYSKRIEAMEKTIEELKHRIQELEEEWDFHPENLIAQEAKRDFEEMAFGNHHHHHTIQ